MEVSNLRGLSRKLLISTLALGTIFGLAGCGSARSDDSANINFVCAFVEGYLDDKALALVDVANGKSASEWIDGTVGQLSSQIAPDSPARPIFDDFYTAMSTWAVQVDSAYLKGDSQAVSNAAAELEVAIDRSGQECESLGWRFKNDWRP